MEPDDFLVQWKRLRARFDIPGRVMYRPDGLFTEEEDEHLNEFWRIFQNEDPHVWQRVVDNCIETWTPSYGTPFPLPAHLKSILSGIETRGVSSTDPSVMDPFERWCLRMNHLLREIPEPKWKSFVDAAMDWGRNHPRWGPLAKSRFWFNLDHVGKWIEETRKGAESDMKEIRKQDILFWRCVFRYYLAEKMGIPVPRQEG